MVGKKLLRFFLNHFPCVCLSFMKLKKHLGGVRGRRGGAHSLSCDTDANNSCQRVTLPCQQQAVCVKQGKSCLPRPAYVKRTQ